MAFDEGLAHRIRETLGDLPDLAEKRMFGGLAFLWHGNMLVGVRGDDLMVRVAPETTEDALAQPGARRFDMTGRPMKGWVVVDGSAVSEDEQLADWIDRARDFVEALPPK
ncbi:RNA methyltransferase [Lentzea sp. NBRC 105346]|uniref:TfoX/Sxy family protein n=1 Tax=Lentzea sp. NBRC 105346 TaxID=3032205 RepID=UPI0024A01823|nr:TfoX/Sxy family protein [Lentzea sp. NBRC 105346]GLZ34599.1 RNA methyltransferase [Lentzea sp. NBRC 105346]